MTAQILAGLVALVGVVVAWYRHRARKAEARADVQEHRADVAEVGRTVDRESDRRETAAHVEAERAIPVPTATDPAAAVKAIEDAVRAEDQRRAGDRVRAKIRRGK